MPDAAVTELLQEHVVAAMIKQARLREAVGDDPQGWAVDVPGGWLRLGRREFTAELIGSEAHGNASFLWAWANPEFTEAAAPAARALRRLGEERGIPDLVADDEIPSDRIDAFVAGVLATGVGDLDGYFLAPYEEEGGVLALGIRDADVRVGAPSGVSVTSTFTNLIQTASPFSHRRAFAHYLARPLRTVPAEVRKGGVVLRVGDGVVTVAFDGEGRIAEMRAELSAP
jgi:hypothetical protein